MNKKQLYDELKTAIINYNEDQVKEVSQKILAANIDPFETIEQSLHPAMKIVGEKFNNLEYFLPQILLATDAMKASIAILTANVDRDKLNAGKKGKVVLGTVSGDIHEIGKEIVGVLFEINGFEVFDLGKDVNSLDFIKKAEEVQADIIGMSALMSTTMTVQKEAIELLKEISLRTKYLVMIGGGPTTKMWAEEIGADGWAETAEEAVQLAIEIIANKKRGDKNHTPMANQ